MGQFSRVGSIVLATALITTALSAPIYAAIRQPFQPLLTKNKRSYLALSWGDIWNVLRGKRKSGGSRGGAICQIAPVKLVDRNAKEETQVIQEVWSESPLFVWTIKGGTARQIQLFVQGNEEPLWSPDIKAGETKINYDGKPLHPGQIYEWQLSALAPAPTKSAGVRFKVMEFQKRDRIAKELTALEGRLKGASVETMALEKADYFTEKGLWSDALRELYSVGTPSTELTGAIWQIQAHDFCAKDKPIVSASR